MKLCGPLAKMNNLWAPYSSNAPEPNFTKHWCDISLFTSCFSFFSDFHLVSAQRPSEARQSLNFRSKMDVLGAHNFFAGPIFKAIFNNICYNQNHVLYSLFPPPSTASQNYHASSTASSQPTTTATYWTSDWLQFYNSHALYWCLLSFRTTPQTTM